MKNKKFMEIFELIHNYKKEYNCYPKQIERYKGKRIGFICNNIRQRKENLTKEQIQLLDEIQFPWRNKNQTSNKRSTWEYGFNKYQNYIECTGKTFVPRKFKIVDDDNDSSFHLGNWCSNQNILRKKGKLSDQRIERLDKLRFPWSEKIRKRLKRERRKEDKYNKRKNANIVWIDQNELIENVKCTICQDIQIKSTIIVRCGHSFCFLCIFNYCLNEIEHISEYVDYLYYTLKIKCPECKVDFDARSHLIPNYNMRRVSKYIVDTLNIKDNDANNNAKDDKQNENERSIKNLLFYRLNRIWEGPQWCAYFDTLKYYDKKINEGKNIDFDKALQQKYNMIQYMIETNKSIIKNNSSHKLMEFL